jgi:hypothetical protein
MASQSRRFTSGSVAVGSGVFVAVRVGVFVLSVVAVEVGVHVIEAVAVAGGLFVGAVPSSSSLPPPNAAPMMPRAMNPASTSTGALIHHDKLENRRLREAVRSIDPLRGARSVPPY